MRDFKLNQDNINIINLVPQFLMFYKKAVGCNENLRFQLWKEHYGFAAVPPGNEGEILSKQMLNGAWEKYNSIIPYLENWKPDCTKIELYLSQVKNVLEYYKPISVTIVFFVGNFEGGAFVAPQGDNSIAVCFPIENGEDEITIVHELTHLVHAQKSGISMAWEKKLAILLLAEGLAMQLSKHLLPEFDDSQYIEHKKGWFQQCKSDEKDIIQGIIPYLNESSSEIIFRFSIGTGTTGQTREAYFVGWILIENMLKNGWSFADIAQIKEENVVDIIVKYL